MDKLTKYTESFCEDCESGIILRNCRECLFNVFRRFDEYPPFGETEEKSDHRPPD